MSESGGITNDELDALASRYTERLKLAYCATGFGAGLALAGATGSFVSGWVFVVFGVFYFSLSLFVSQSAKAMLRREARRLRS